MSTHNPTRRDFLQAGTSASLGALITSTVGSLFAQAAQAQTPPPQLRVLCTGPAGSIPDIVTRRITEQLAQNYPQGAIVDNKPGAAGQIAMAALKAAPADGSTMLLAQGALATIFPYLYNKLAYDPERDLQPVSLAGEMTLALAVGPAVLASITTVPDLNSWLCSPSSPTPGPLGKGPYRTCFRRCSSDKPRSLGSTSFIRAAHKPLLIFSAHKSRPWPCPKDSFVSIKKAAEFGCWPPPVSRGARFSLRCRPSPSSATKVWKYESGLPFSCQTRRRLR